MLLKKLGILYPVIYYVLDMQGVDIQNEIWVLMN